MSEMSEGEERDLYRMLNRLLSKIKHELKVYQFVLKDGRTPKVAKVLLAIAVFYAVSPVDLIPDFIPVIGFLDDIIIIPGLIVLALKMTPKEIVQDCRIRASTA